MCRKISFLLLCLLMGKVSNCFSQTLPIKPARTISFTTDEGSYMDVDLSPDGNTIVFDILGDIYSIPVTGGNATQLTRGLALNRWPVWSPDSKQIAFISDASGANRLTIMNADGNEERTLNIAGKQLIDNNNLSIQAVPAWTPDGNYIAVNDSLYHLAGGVMGLPPGIKYNVQFSNDGQYLYFDNHNTDTGKNVVNLERYCRHTGTATKLAKLPLYNAGFGGGWPGNQSVSPDGRWLAYLVGPEPESSLHIRNLITGADRLMASEVEQHRRIFAEHFSFAPDSKSILIGFGGMIHRIDVESGADHIIPFKANVNVDLGAFNYNTFKITDNDSLKVRLTHSANASPDGKSLVFTALNRIYVMTLPNGTAHPLVNHSFGQFQPVYSPDGKWIAYVTWSDTQGGNVWRVPAAGGKPEQLTRQESYYEYPAWSPDGQHLAIVKRRDYLSDRQLCVIDIAHKNSYILADTIYAINQLSFASDGNSVILTSGGGSAGRPLKLVSIPLTGRKQQVLATTVQPVQQIVFSGDDPDSDGGLRQITVSPDRRYIVYQINEDLYLAPFPNLGVPVVLNSTTGLRPIIRFAVGGLDPNWEQGGKILSWSYSNHFYHINPDKILAMAVQSAKDSAEKNALNNGVYRLNIVPDETIPMNIKASKLYAHGTIALRNVRVISMKGDEVIEHGTIVIKSGRFIAVGPMESIYIPANTKIYDLKGKTVMPGMIDVHDHIKPPGNVLIQQYPDFLVNLAYGITTARDPAAANLDEFAYAELLETGQTIGPRLFSVGMAVGEGDIIINSQEDARETIRKRAELGAICIKQYEQQTRVQRQWVLMACREYSLNMTNEGSFDPRGEIAMIKDGSTGVEHAYGWGNVYNDIIQFFARSGTWHTPTLTVMNFEGESAGAYFENLYRQHPDKKLFDFLPSDGYWYTDLMKTPANLSDMVSADFKYTSTIEASIRKEGGHIGTGGHSEAPGIATHWELWALQMGGLSNLEALQEATISGAEAIGVQQDLGSIEPGKIADMLILDKNPLDDIHNTMSIKYVMKDGILYNGDNLDELWPVYKKCPDWKFDKKYFPKDKK